MKDPYSVIMWFTSKNTAEIIKFKDVNNTPKNCSVRVLFDLKVPNKIVRTVISEGSSPFVTNYNRINVK